MKTFRTRPIDRVLVYTNEKLMLKALRTALVRSGLTLAQKHEASDRFKSKYPKYSLPTCLTFAIGPYTQGQWDLREDIFQEFVGALRMQDL